MCTIQHTRSCAQTRVIRAMLSVHCSCLSEPEAKHARWRSCCHSRLPKLFPGNSRYLGWGAARIASLLSRICFGGLSCLKFRSTGREKVLHALLKGPEELKHLSMYSSVTCIFVGRIMMAAKWHQLTGRGVVGATLQRPYITGI